MSFNLVSLFLISGLRCSVVWPNVVRSKICFRHRYWDVTFEDRMSFKVVFLRTWDSFVLVIERSFDVWKDYSGSSIWKPKTEAFLFLNLIFEFDFWVLSASVQNNLTCKALSGWQQLSKMRVRQKIPNNFN